LPLGRRISALESASVVVVVSASVVVVSGIEIVTSEVAVARVVAVVDTVVESTNLLVVVSEPPPQPPRDSPDTRIAPAMKIRGNAANRWASGRRSTPKSMTPPILATALA
jgi:hypothetical protein